MSCLPPLDSLDQLAAAFCASSDSLDAGVLTKLVGLFAVYGCSCSLDLLANLAQLYPEAVLQAAFGRWQELAARWISGFSEAGIGGGGPIRGGGELGSRLAWVTRDACFVLQLWAALFEELFR